MDSDNSFPLFLKGWLLRLMRTAEKGIKRLQNLPYSLDLIPATYFLFPKVKNAQTGMHLHMNFNNIKNRSESNRFMRNVRKGNKNLQWPP